MLYHADAAESINSAPYKKRIDGIVETIARDSTALILSLPRMRHDRVVHCMHVIRPTSDNGKLFINNQLAAKKKWGNSFVGGKSNQCL